MSRPPAPLSDAPSKSPGGADDGGSKPSWSKFASVIDLKVTSKSSPPLDPPIGQYLEEVLMGMRHGVGDKQASPSPATELDVKVSPVGRLKGLARVLSGEAACLACHALFFISIGCVFRNMQPDVLGGFREQLGHNWFLLTLQAAQEFPKDRDSRDWLLDSLPFVFAQAIYRMFCDGFDEDRKDFLASADKLLQKLSMVAHFELVGFQLNVDTIRKARRRLFVGRVIKAPHTDQREFLRGQRRQEMLENHNMSAGARPLAFGREDGPPLEETQLEHVMQGRQDRRRINKRASPLGKGSVVNVAPDSPVPADLSVDRYESFANVGAALLQKHLSQLAAMMGEDYQAECQHESDDDDDDGPDTPTSDGPRSLPPSQPQSPLARSNSAWSVQSGGGFAPDSPRDSEWSETGGAHTRSPGDESGSPGSPKRNNAYPSWGRARAVARVAVLKGKASEKREKEAKARRLRQEALHKAIAVEPLPDELCQRELCTTWVSPAQRSLVPDAPDRRLLKKTAAETFTLKMATRVMPARALSTPALRTLQPAGKGNDIKRRAADAVTVSQLSGKDESSVAGGSARAASRSNDHNRRGRRLSWSATGDIDLNALSGSPGAGGVPRVASAGAPFGPGRLGRDGPSRLLNAGAEIIHLEPPPNLGGRVILERLEAQAKAFRQQSFAIYIKEYDVFTGLLKMRFDEKRLRDEEDAYLRKLDELIGGPPKKNLVPAPMMRLRTSNSTGRLPALAT